MFLTFFFSRYIVIYYKGFVMGFQHLLRATYTGSVGGYTGAIIKGRAIVKSKIDSRSPLTSIQEANIKAFVKLNRFVSALYKAFGDTLELRSRKMYPHNVLANRLKSMIQGKVFNPWGYVNYYGNSTEIKIESFSYQPASQQIDINFQYSNYETYPDDVIYDIIFFDNTGQADYAVRHKGKAMSLAFNQVLQTWRRLFIAIRFYRFVDGKSFNLGASQMSIYSFNRSLTEQTTQDTWLNGNLIYSKSFELVNFQVPTIGSSQVAVLANNTNYISSVFEGCTSSNGRKSGVNMPLLDRTSLLSAYMDTDFSLNVKSLIGNASITYSLLTIFYSKTDETPVR